MKILLHICCAPCSIYPFKELLKGKDIKLTGFYFNPNIYPCEEYVRRRSALEEYAKRIFLDIIYPEYKPTYFFINVMNNNKKEIRCRICWQMRLEETALYAKENGFDTFSTTLLISPYQEHLILKEIGSEIAQRYNLTFYYQDFRKGFKESQDEARSHNLYRQKYCGCLYSERERFKKGVRV